MKAVIRFATFMLAAAIAGGLPSLAASGGGTGSSAAPGGAPAAPGAVNQGTIASPPVTGAATPVVPNGPVVPPVTGAATPLNPNTPVPGTPSGMPSNATLNLQPPTGGAFTPAQAPLGDIAGAIQNPFSTTQAAVQNLTVVRQNGSLILSGIVHTQQDKDTAALRAAAASGGEPVINNLVVQ